MKTTIVFFIMLALFGCSNQPGIKVVNFKNNESIVFSGESGFYDEIVPMSMDDKFIYSIFKKNNHIELVKRNLAGSILKQDRIPLFSKWYGSTPYALSPDESKFVFYKDNTRNLYLYDLLGKKESLLLKDISSSAFTIKGIFWMDSDNLIILLDEDEDIGRKGGEIFKMKVSTKATVEKLELDDPHDYSFSSASMLLAVAPMVRGAGIKIIDLRNFAIVSEIPNFNKLTWMNLPAWNRSGTKLVYLDGAGVLSIYNIKDKSSVSIQNIPKGEVGYFTGILNDDICALSYGQPDGKSKLYFVDVNTKKVIKTISDVWGTIVLIDSGNVIAYEIH